MKDIELALSQYQSKVDSMRHKRKLGIITDDEWFDFIKREDTLWNIIIEV